MRTHVVILGAGFGGLQLSSRLSAELADEVEVTLIDKSDSFIFGFSKLDVMFGRRTMDEVRIPYRHIASPAVTFRQEESAPSIRRSSAWSPTRGSMTLMSWWLPSEPIWLPRRHRD